MLHLIDISDLCIVAVVGSGADAGSFESGDHRPGTHAQLPPGRYVVGEGGWPPVLGVHGLSRSLRASLLQTTWYVSFLPNTASISVFQRKINICFNCYLLWKLLMVVHIG